MSLFRDNTSQRPAPLQAGLSRLLLASQFNFRQKSWSLPRFNSPQDVESKLRFFAREFPDKFFSDPTKFSDPSLGGVIPMKPFFSQAGIRPSRLLGKLKQPTKRNQ
jgi:hypothetical protein